MLDFSWISISPISHFSLANIPFGIITTPQNSTPRPATRIGDTILDLSAFTQNGGFDQCTAMPVQHHTVFLARSLNDFAALGRSIHRSVRTYLQDVLRQNTPYPAVLRDVDHAVKATCLFDADVVTMHLPMQIGDYTDFYAGGHHAYNVGVLFRGPENALQPNYTHLPVGYHGRASSIVVSGTPIRRPHGQILALPSPQSSSPSSIKPQPVLAPTQKLDFELELGCFISIPNDLGTPIPIHEASQHIFGYVLLNDWSARDIQAWEYVPLGPFNGKNFGTSISAWVISADVVEEAGRCRGLRKGDLGRMNEDGAGDDGAEGIEEGEGLLSYFRQDSATIGIDIDLEVSITPATSTTECSSAHAIPQPAGNHSNAGKKETMITRTNGRNLMYSFEQMIAHHTIGGCNLRTGDLLGSGTISGASFSARNVDPSSFGTGSSSPAPYGSLLEMTRNGKIAVDLHAGTERRFLQDGDEVVIRGVLGSGVDGNSGMIGFGDCTGMILPAHT